MGRRIAKSFGDVVNWYVYDGSAIIAAYNSSGTVTARYAHGLNIDEPLAVQQGSATSFYHADGLGSIVALTNVAGSVVQTYSYDSFGNVTLSGGINQPFTYTAREYDYETGLYFYRARYYDPKAGRFIIRDPISFAGGDVNLYGYVGNNPVNRIDPIGLFDWGFGGVVGPFNFEWNSSQPYKTQPSIVTDLELGGGFKFCFDNPFKDDIKACGDKVPEMPFDINIGIGKYTGVSTNNKKFCINVGLSAGFSPIDISIPY